MQKIQLQRNGTTQCHFQFRLQLTLLLSEREETNDEEPVSTKKTKEMPPTAIEITKIQEQLSSIQQQLCDLTTTTTNNKPTGDNHSDFSHLSFPFASLPTFPSVPMATSMSLFNMMAMNQHQQAQLYHIQKLHFSEWRELLTNKGDLR